jgi:RNA polymerase sigma factor (sigma-70 family)
MIEFDPIRTAIRDAAHGHASCLGPGTNCPAPISLPAAVSPFVGHGREVMMAAQRTLGPGPANTQLVEGRAVPTDGALIEWSVRGRADAFVEVVQRHEVAVHGFLARRAGRQAADDLLGEVWVRAFGARATFRADCADARPWLYGIARNVLRAHWRAAARSGPPPADPPPGGLPPQEQQHDPWDDVVDRLDSATRARAVADAVRALPPGERDVLLLVAWEQLTPAEAAVVLGVPQGTARSRLHRARATLQLALARSQPDTARMPSAPHPVHPPPPPAHPPSPPIPPHAPNPVRAPNPAHPSHAPHPSDAEEDPCPPSRPNLSSWTR